MTTTTPAAELARLDGLITALSTEIADIEREADRARGEFARLMVDLRERIEGKRSELAEAMAAIDGLIAANPELGGEA